MPSKRYDYWLDRAVELFSQGRSWNAGGCCGDATDEKQDDIAFLRRLVDYVSYDITKHHNFEVDEKRIYVTGISNGGFMAHRVACEMSDIIAAAAPVAGPLSNEEISESDALSSQPLWRGDMFQSPNKPMWKETISFECGRPVPILYIHNRQDTIVPYKGSSELHIPSANKTVGKWKEINGLQYSQSHQVQSHKDNTTCEIH